MTLPGSIAPVEDGLYIGRVMHHRIAPVRHRFVYRVFSLLLDIDRLPELDKQLRLFSRNRANLVSFFDRDHGAGDGTPLRPWVLAQLAGVGLDFECRQILLFCFPRVWGYVFNPISVYFCHATDGRLAAIVYEVKNTFGAQHPYVLPVDRQASPAQQIRQSATKELYVSPFIEMAARYQFRITPPGERFSLMISEWGDEGTRLVATLRADRRPLTDRALAWAALRDPLMSLKVTAGIHLEALLLWLKGARLQPRPDAHGPAAVCPSYGRSAKHGDRVQTG
jgi:DUF1365 family protein